MSLNTRDEAKDEVAIQDDDVINKILDSEGDNLSGALNNRTVGFLGGAVAAILKRDGEPGRRNGAEKINGADLSLTGTITAVSTAVTGSGTLFLTELFIGAWIAGTAGQLREVQAIADNLNLTLTAAFSADFAGQAGVRMQTTAERIALLESTAEQNLVVNGNMDFFMEGDKTSIADAAYAATLVKYTKVGAMIQDAVESTDVPTQLQSGYSSVNSLFTSVTTIDASIAAGDKATWSWFIEGYDIQKIFQKNFWFSFWIRAVKTGIYCVSFRNAAKTRSFVHEITVNTTDVWEFKEFTVLFDEGSGVWEFESLVGLDVTFAQAAGTTFHTPADAWQTGDFVATANQVNGVDNTANDLKIAQVQIVEGSLTIPFRRGKLADELARVHRLFEKSYSIGVDPGTVTDVGMAGDVDTGNVTPTVKAMVYFVRKRTVPTFTAYSNVTGASGVVRDIAAPADDAQALTGLGERSVDCGSGGSLNISFQWTADARF